MNDPTRIVLVRHGHTEANGCPAGMRLSGWTDTPLSEEGSRQAALVAETLRRRGAFAAVYTSPLQRARRTTAAIRAAVRAPAFVHPGLREIFCGEVDGESVDRVRVRHPDAWRRNAEEADEDFRWPGGESYREFRARCLRAVRTIARRHRGERVLVVTHAGFISQVLGWIAGVRCAMWSAFRPRNASISAVEWSRDWRVILAFDDHRHLVGYTSGRPIPPRHGG